MIFYYSNGQILNSIYKFISENPDVNHDMLPLGATAGYNLAEGINMVLEDSCHIKRYDKPLQLLIGEESKVVNTFTPVDVQILDNWESFNGTKGNLRQVIMLLYEDTYIGK